MRIVIKVIYGSPLCFTLTILCYIQYCAVMNSKERIVERLMQEHHRGSLTLVALTLLQEPRYGYSLINELQESGLEITQDTLYPLLRRLEQQGLLTSEWIVDESRPRKYYTTSPMGSAVLGNLQKEWLQYADIIRGIIT